MRFNIEIAVLYRGEGADAARDAMRNVAEESKRAADGVEGIGEKLGELKSKLLELAAVLGVGLGLEKFIEDASRQQAVMAQLGVGLKDAGAAAGFTREKLLALSEEVARTTTVSKTSALAAIDLGLTFTDIHANIFPKVIKTATDLAARMALLHGGAVDMSGAMQMLSKAIDQPATGMTMLRRAGVILNEAQKETIKNLAETGHQLAAQRELLADVAEKVKGSAAAYRDTLGGSLAVLKNKFEEFSETVGNAMSPALRAFAAQLGEIADGGTSFAEQLGGALGAAVQSLGSVLAFVTEHWSAVKALLEALLAMKVVEWIEGISVALRAMSLSNPFTLAIAGAVALFSILRDANAEVGKLQGRFQQELDADKFLAGLKTRTANLTDAEYEEAKAIQAKNIERKAQIELDLQAAIAAANLQQQSTRSSLQTALGAGSALLHSGPMGMVHFLNSPPTDESLPEAERVNFLRDTLASTQKTITDAEAALKRLTTEQQRNGAATKDQADAVGQLGKQQRAALEALQAYLDKLRQQAEISGRMVAATALGVDSVRAATREQAIQSAILDESLKLKKVHLALSDAAAAAIRRDTGAIEDNKVALERLKVVLSDVDKLWQGAFEFLAKLGTAQQQFLGAKSMDDYAQSLRQVDVQLSALNLELTRLVPGSDAYGQAVGAINALETKRADIVSRMPALYESFREAAKREAEDQLASIGQVVDRLNQETAAYQTGGDAAATALQRVLSLHDQVLQIVSQSVHVIAGEDAAGDFATRWLAAVRRVKDALTANFNAQQSAAIWKPLEDAWQGFLQDGLSAFNQLVTTGQFSFEALAKSLLDTMLKTFEQMLQNWIQTQITMAAAQKAREAAGAYGPTQGGGNIAGSLASSYFSGGGAGLSASAGYFGVFAIALYALTKYLEAQHAHEFDTGESVGVTGGFFNSPDTYYGNAKAAVDAVRQFILDFEEVTRSLITDLPQIGLKIENDGKKFRAYVGSAMIGEFSSLGDAVVAAFKRAVQLGNVQNLAAEFQALLSPQNSQNPALQTADGFTAALKAINTIVNLGLNPLVQALRQAEQGFDGMRRQVLDLLPASAGLIAAFAKIGAAEVKYWQDQQDQILGVQKTDLEKRKEDGALYNAELAERKTAIALTIEQIKAELVRDGIIVQGMKAITDSAMIFFRAATGTAGGRNNDDGSGNTGGIDDGRKGSPGSNGGISPYDQALLDELQSLQQLLASLPDAINLADIKAIGKTGGASGQSDASKLLQFLAAFDHSQLDSYHQALDDIAKKYAEATLLAHGNADAQALLNKDRAKEIELAKQQALQAGKDLIAADSGTPLERQLANLLKPFEDAIKASVEVQGIRGNADLPKLQGAEGAAAKGLGQQVIASLNLPIEQAKVQFQSTAASLTFLKDHAAELGLTAQQVGDVIRQTSDQVTLSIFDQMSQFTTDQADKLALERVRWAIEKATFETQIESAHALKQITDDQYAILQRIYAGLPDAPPGASGDAFTLAGALQAAGAAQQSAAQTMQQAADAFAQSTKKLIDFQKSLLLDAGLSPLTPAQKLAEARKQVNDGYAAAQAGNIDARNKFADLARAFLDQDRSYNASGGTYSADFSMIQQMLDTLIGRTTYQVPGAPTVTGGGQFGGGGAAQTQAIMATVDSMPIVMAIDTHRAQNAGDAAELLTEIKGMRTDLRSVALGGRY